MAWSARFPEWHWPRRRRRTGVAGIFVRFYTLRRSVWLFNALQRNRSDLSTGCWLWHRPYQPRRRSPWGGKRRPGALRGCLFASMSHPTKRDTVSFTYMRSEADCVCGIALQGASMRCRGKTYSARTQSDVLILQDFCLSDTVG